MANLAQVLEQIERHDHDYEIRYVLVFQAVALALEAGYPAGFRLDLDEPEWPVAFIDLPNGTEPGPPLRAGGGFSVSAADQDLLEFRWYDNGNRYFKRQDHLPAPTGYLHRLIAERLFGEIPDGYEVDHIDRDPTNNTRWNLRLATSHVQKLNCGRPSVRQRKNGRWQAMASVNGRQLSLGMADTEHEARLLAYYNRERMLAAAIARGETKTWPSQVSWHMPQHTVAWDGHDTAEKYRRIREFVASVGHQEVPR